jgi:hypothetical protein
MRWFGLGRTTPAANAELRALNHCESEQFGKWLAVGRRVFGQANLDPSEFAQFAGAVLANAPIAERDTRILGSTEEAEVLTLLEDDPLAIHRNV